MGTNKEAAMGASLLPWWGWLVCGAIGLAMGTLISDVRHVETPTYRIVVGFVFILAGVVGLTLGLVGFVKYGWA